MIIIKILVLVVMNIIYTYNLYAEDAQLLRMSSRVYFFLMSCQFGSHFKTCGFEDLIVVLLPLVFSLTRSPIG